MTKPTGLQPHREAHRCQEEQQYVLNTATNHGGDLSWRQDVTWAKTKTVLSLGGKRLVDRVVEVMRSVFDSLMVTNTPDVYAALGLPMVQDV